MSRRAWLAAAFGGVTVAAAGALLASGPVAEATRTARSAAPLAQTTDTPSDQLLVTLSRGTAVALVDSESGVQATIDVGAAPHNLARHPDGRVFIATAEGVSVLDLQQQRRVALVPFLVDPGPPRFGEFRPGGMGIAVTPDGRAVAVGVYRSSESAVEIIDAASLTTLGLVTVGTRPFQVVAAHHSRHAFSIDHDGYTVTVIDLETGGAQALPAHPLGRGAFDKPHYAALRSDGALVLPYQGRALQTLDPFSGAESVTPLSAQTHQHGVALSPDERLLLIVGTGPAGGVTGGPSLTVLDLPAGQETILPLTKAHELVAVTPDGGRAYLTGGNLLTGGWNGLTVVDLTTHAQREITVPDAPLDAIFI